MSKKVYEGLTYDKLVEAVGAVFLKCEGNWRDKIKEGFMYSIGGDNMLVVTGYGGAIAFGEELEKNGMPDCMIQSSILVSQDGGRNFYKLSEITWKRKEEDKRTNYYDSTT